MAPPQRIREVLDATNYGYLCTNIKRLFECKTNQFPNHVVSNSRRDQILNSRRDQILNCEASNHVVSNCSASNPKFPKGSNSESRSAKFPQGSNLHKQTNRSQQCQGKGGKRYFLQFRIKIFGILCLHDFSNMEYQYNTR